MPNQAKVCECVFQWHQANHLLSFYSFINMSSLCVHGHARVCASVNMSVCLCAFVTTATCRPSAQRHWCCCPRPTVVCQMAMSHDHRCLAIGQDVKLKKLVAIPAHEFLGNGDKSGTWWEPKSKGSNWGILRTSLENTDRNLEEELRNGLTKAMRSLQLDECVTVSHAFSPLFIHFYYTGLNALLIRKETREDDLT